MEEAVVKQMEMQRQLHSQLEVRTPRTSLRTYKPLEFWNETLERVLGAHGGVCRQADGDAAAAALPAGGASAQKESSGRFQRANTVAQRAPCDMPRLHGMTRRMHRLQPGRPGRPCPSAPAQQLVVQLRFLFATDGRAPLLRRRSGRCSATWSSTSGTCTA